MNNIAEQVKKLKSIDSFHIKYIRTKDVKVAECSQVIQNLEAQLGQFKSTREIVEALREYVPQKISSNNGQHFFSFIQTDTYEIAIQHLPQTGGDVCVSGTMSEFDMAKLFDWIEERIVAKINELKAIQIHS